MMVVEVTALMASRGGLNLSKKKITTRREGKCGFSIIIQHQFTERARTEKNFSKRRKGQSRLTYLRLREMSLKGRGGQGIQKAKKGRSLKERLRYMLKERM